MPNRKQIIVISVLALIALLIGYFKNPLNLSMGKRAEVQGPIPPTIVTNVITNLANNIVTNVITNAVPVQPKPNPAKPKPNPAKPKPNPVKPRTISQKDIVGTYEQKVGNQISRYVFLDNGTMEYYNNGKKENTGSKWSIVGNEVHRISTNNNAVLVYRSNPDNSITAIALITSGKRIDFPKEQQATTYKKINQPQPTRTLTLEEKDIVGTYERNTGSYTYRHVYLDNGIREYYRNGEKTREDVKWSIVDNELHIKHPNNIVHVYRLNPDNSITYFASIRKGKRTDRTKEQQKVTLKKIK